jgi:hypothetical protein
MSDAFMAGFYGKLNSGAVASAVGSRVHALEAPVSSSLPLIVYSMDAPLTERFFGGAVRTRANFTVTVFGKTDLGPAAVADIDEKVYSLMNGSIVAVADHDRGVIRGVSRGGVALEGDYYRSDSTFEMVATSSS